MCGSLAMLADRNDTDTDRLLHVVTYCGDCSENVIVLVQ